MDNYFLNCVSWPRHDVNALHDMIDNSIDITRKTFLKHVDDSELADIAESLGYCWHHSQGLTMAGDWYVTYSRSKLHGKRVYFFTHSAIEYVFTTQNQAPVTARPKEV